MDGQTFLDELRDEHETVLSRLGSSKAVYALTDGEMEGDAVRAGTARELDAVASALERWADAAEGDDAALFAEVASFATERAGELDAEATGSKDSAATRVTAQALGSLEGDLARTAGLAAALLVLGKLSEQLVGFFVGDADRAGAGEFREIRDALQDYRDDAAGLLGSLCTDDADWTSANEAAAGVVDGAYDWYVGTLEGMGVQPKNVC